MEDKLIISLASEQRNLLLKYESYFADNDLFRLVSIALKKGESFEICLDEDQLECLLDQMSELSNNEDDQKLQNQLDDLSDYLEGFYDVFEEDDYSEHSSNTGSVCRLKVFMIGSKRIWRMIAIREGQTLHDLHKIIFEAFDRYDEHMYSFFFPRFPEKRFNPRKIYDSSDEYTHPYAFESQGPFGSEESNASIATIESLGLHEDQVFYYLFDFGDDLWHEISVDSTDRPAINDKYPCIVERKGQSPEQYPDPDEDW